MLEQFKSQHVTLDQFLEVQRSHPPHPSLGVRITMQIYTYILEDAIKTLKSLIDYLEVHS